MIKIHCCVARNAFARSWAAKHFLAPYFLPNLNRVKNSSWTANIQLRIYFKTPQRSSSAARDCQRKPAYCVSALALRNLHCKSARASRCTAIKTDLSQRSLFNFYRLLLFRPFSAIDFLLQCLFYLRFKSIDILLFTVFSPVLYFDLVSLLPISRFATKKRRKRFLFCV